MVNKIFFVLFLASLLAGGSPAAEAEVQTVLKQHGIHGGLIVVLGLSDDMDLTAFRYDDNVIVQGLDTDPARVAAAKKVMAEKGLSGTVTARVFDGKKLPFAENMANGIVIPDTGYQIPDEEIERVLVPGGVSTIINQQSAIINTFINPWPDDIDDWSHFNHDAAGTMVSRDRRVGPPRRIKWSAPPLMTRNHFAVSFTTAIIAQGRIFSVLDEKSKQISRTLPSEWSLIARDAFNGLPLWKKPLPHWNWAGQTQPGFGHPGGSKYGSSVPQTIVTDGKYVYLFEDSPWTFMALDAATGETVRRFDDLQGVGEMVCDEGIIYIAVRPPVEEEIADRKGRMRKQISLGEARLVAIKVGSWETLLDVPIPGYEYETLSVHHGRVFFEAEHNIAALNAADGKQLWRTEFTEKQKYGHWRMWNLVATGDLLIASRSYMGGRKGATMAFDAATGRQVWRNESLSQARDGVFPIDGKLYVGARAYALEDGKPMGNVATDGLWSEGHHFRCYPWRATPRFLISNYRGCEFLAIHPEDPGRKNDYLRGNCLAGTFPAHGLLYKTPHGCFCYNGTMLNGFLALAPEADTTEPDIAPENPARLEKGTAFDAIQHSAFSNQQWSDWPMYRQNAKRLGSSATKVGADVQVAWDIEAGRSLTPPVCAGGLLVVADKDTHRVLAYDAATGQPRWTFTADARIDSAPTLLWGEGQRAKGEGQRAKGKEDVDLRPPSSVLCFFGSSDGYVYCVDAANGALVWKFRAAPNERWITRDGQLESVWPVHGSVLVEDGVLYFTAGRHTWFDGGIHAYALDPATGKVLHYRRLKDEALADGVEYGEELPYSESAHSEGARSYILVAGENHLFLGPIVLTRELEIVQAPYISVEPQGVEIIKLTGEPYVDQESFVKISEEKSFTATKKLQRGFLGMGAKRTELHLSSTGGFLDQTTPFERHYWMYAKRWPGNKHGNLGAKTGTLLCIDDENTYGIKTFNFRDRYGSGDPRVSDKGQLIFADDIDNEPVIPDRTRGHRAGVGYYRTAPPLWHHWKKMHLNAMAAGQKHLFVCGAPLDKGGDPLAPFEGRAGSVLMTFDKKTGEPVAELALDDQPLFDGLIAADGKLFMSTMNGKIICLKTNP